MTRVRCSAHVCACAAPARRTRKVAHVSVEAPQARAIATRRGLARLRLLHPKVAAPAALDPLAARLCIGVQLLVPQRLGAGGRPPAAAAAAVRAVAAAATQVAAVGAPPSVPRGQGAQQRPSRKLQGAARRGGGSEGKPIALAAASTPARAPFAPAPRISGHATGSWRQTRTTRRAGAEPRQRWRPTTAPRWRLGAAAAPLAPPTPAAIEQPPLRLN